MTNEPTVPGVEISRWLPLHQAAHLPARFGAKAAQLALLRDAGLPVVEGWVLPTEIVARLQHDVHMRDELGRELLAKGAHDWMLRSSSPLEDRPAASAAGLFHSGHAGPNPEEIAAELARVAGAAQHPFLRELLAVESVPVALLAQRHLRLQIWLTVELSGKAARGEGWRWERSGPVAVTTGPEDPADRDLRALVELARRAARLAAGEAVLLEVGADADGTWLLQMRPIRRGRTPSAPPPGAISAATPAPSPVGLGLPVHPGDGRFRWEWDREHCPTPLCPLLAGLFGAWLAEGPASYPSRLVEGRWHDRIGPRKSEANAPGSGRRAPEDTRPGPATPPVPDAARTPAEVERELRRWEQEHAPALEREAQALGELSNRIATEPQRWPEFTERWLGFQADYFARRPAGTRRWARSIVRDAWAEGMSLPSLGETVSRGRARRWAELAGRVEALETPPPRSAEALEHWTRAHGSHALARDLRRELMRCAHLSVLPYDGRAPSWEEDPTPFWREISRRRRQGGRGSEDDWAQRGSDLLLDLAARVLAAAEDDNELLMMVYAYFRRAVRHLGPFLLPGRPWEQLLDVLPADVDHALSAGHRVEAPALVRGRALRARWELGPSSEIRAASLQGKAAAGGRARGPVWRGTSLQDLPDTEEALVAVVPTVTPADAVCFARLAALVCEGGDVLGHASVLAREHGLPCVVGVARARDVLAWARRAMVDGDRGRVVVLEP